MIAIRCPACGRRLFDADLRQGGTAIQMACPRRECGRLVLIRDDGSVQIVSDRRLPVSLHQSVGA